MDKATHNKIVSFIWGTANDSLRYHFGRSNDPDVILPMYVNRRMDALHEARCATEIQLGIFA
jgi:type I restriction enzyme M protein